MPDRLMDREGIGGWLLVFVLWLALTSGLSLFIGLRLTGYQRSEMGAFGVLGVVTIVLLVRMQASGLLLAKTLLAFAIVMSMLQIGEAKASQQGSQVARNIIIPGLWFAYLTKSVRVKNTFGST